MKKIISQSLICALAYITIISCKKQITEIPAEKDYADKTSELEVSPTVRFASPKKEDTVLGIITIKIKATSDVTIDSVQCKIDGVYYNSKTAAPYEFTWNTTTVMNGAHQLKATVFDHSGNKAIKNITVNVENAGVLSMEQELLALINAERSARSIQLLTFNSNILNAARFHAQDMADNNFFNHLGSAGDTPNNRLEDNGYHWTSAAENLAGGQTKAIDVFNAWMANSGQRSIMLDANLKDAAIGCSYRFQSAFTTYWVGNFAKTN